MDFVERLNLRLAWRWFGLSGIVGIVAGLGALVFQWLTENGVRLFWNGLVGYTPSPAGGEPLGFPTLSGPPSALFLVAAPAIGGLLAGFLVFRFAPEARGHGTDAAIRAYHKEHGRIRARIPVVKMLASACVLSSGGSAGREGPIAQIGAGFGSALASFLKLSDRDRRILMAAGLASGVGSIFRAPLAGALFASEVLYGEPELEPEVILPGLISSITAYCVFCSVHGFGHLFTGTQGFAFDHPLTLVVYAILGIVVSLGAIVYVTVFGGATALFARLRITNYAKPAIGAALTGLLGLAAWKATGDLASLAIMGPGYGTLQSAVAAHGDLGPSLQVLLVVAIGKIVTTSLTIGSGGSGGVFGPSMVIGGCLGAAVGTIFHRIDPVLAPDVGPFTIVGMAGFFAGAANTPVSTLIMVADISGNYSLLLPSMLVVAIAYFLAKNWTIYPEQVPTRLQSDAHRGDFIDDILERISVGSAMGSTAAVSIRRNTTLAELVDLVSNTNQNAFPILDGDGRLEGLVAVDAIQAILAQSGHPILTIAHDLESECKLFVTSGDTLRVAMNALTLLGADEVPVVDGGVGGRFVGFVRRHDLIAVYDRKLVEARAADGVGPAPEES